MHFKTARFVGLAASVCLVISTFVAVLAYFGVTIPDYPTFSLREYPSGRLACDYIDKLWLWRRSFYPSQLAIDFFLASGLLMTIHPMNCLRKIYSQTRAPRILLDVMTLSFTIAVALNAMEFLENLGTEAAGMQLASVTIECPGDRQSLEISYNMGQALSVWIFSLDYVFLATAFGISSYMAFRYPLLQTWHGVAGATCAVLALAAFALEIAQVANAAVFTAFGAVTLLLMGVFFPGWLMWLSWMLGSDDWKLEERSAATAAAQIPPTL